MSKIAQTFCVGVATLMIATAACAFTPVPTPVLQQLGFKVPVINNPGGAGYAIADFDDDGLADIAVSGSAGGGTKNGVVQLFGARQSDFGWKQSIILDATAASRILAWTPNGGAAHLLSIGADGMATVFVGWPLHEVRQFSVESSVSSAAIGDVNVDGQLDLVTVTYDSLQVFNLATGVAEWSVADGGTDVALGQLDADLPLEIVIAGAAGVVIDGATHVVDWSYIDGFGARVATGAIGPNGAEGFVAADAWDHFTAFQTEPWSPLWDASTPQGIGAIAVADLDGDGQAEIIQGDDQWGSVQVYDSATHVVRTSIVSPGYSVLRVGALDLLGDGHPLVTLSAASSNEPYAPIYLANPTTGAIVSDLPENRSGSYAAVLLGNFDHDGGVELVYGADGNYFSTNKGVLTIVDARDGTLQWQSSGSLNLETGINLQLVALRKNGDQLILVGNVWPTGLLRAINTTSHAVTWQVGSYSSGPMHGRPISGAALYDFNGDSTKDVVVSTGAASSGASGAKLFVFSGVDGSLLWQSVAMNAESFGAFAGDTGFGTGAEVVAVLSDSLRAYNVATKLLDWVLPVDNDGASLIANGASSIEMAVFLGNTLSFYDGATHALLRSFTLDGTVTAVKGLGDISHVLIAVDGHLEIVDGLNGAVLASSPFLGYGLGANNQLAALQTGPQSWLIGAGSDLGVFRYRFDSTDQIFANGFDTAH